MAPKYSPVIIFGPTGDVGGAAALEAKKLDASVWLAMRNTDKPIAAIPAAEQQSSAFHRVRADLTDPESVRAAVEQSGAKSAFVYLTFGTSMEPSFRAMKDAGVERVVFLSSFSIHPDEDLAQVPPSRVIPYVHAQAEVAIEKVGLACTSLRGGQFASNIMKQGLDRSKTPWEANIVADLGPRDNISPSDIGKVAGAVLVGPPVDTGRHVIYLLGPQLLTEREMVEVVKRVSGQEITVHEHTPAEMAASLARRGLPDVMKDYMQLVWEGGEWWSGDKPFAALGYPEVTGNVSKYSGYEPESFESYVSANLEHSPV